MSKNGHRIYGWFMWCFMLSCDAVDLACISVSFQGFAWNPMFYIFTIVLLGNIVYLPILLKAGKFYKAFIVSSLIYCSDVCVKWHSVFIHDLYRRPSIFIIVLRSITHPQVHWHYKQWLVIAIIGIPIVIAYSIFIHYVFRGEGWDYRGKLLK